ncbi:MAG: hypothetical protein EA401_01035, partial [Planctomycetota bacterium]
MWSGRICCLLLLIGLSIAAPLVATENHVSQGNEQARELYEKGRYGEALQQLRSMLTAGDPEHPPSASEDRDLAESFIIAMKCFDHLGIWEEYDDFIDAVIASHPASWRLGEQVVGNLSDVIDSVPYPPRFAKIVDGEMRRGWYAGDWRNLQARDRVRALRYAETLLPHILTQEDAEAGAALLTLAEAWFVNPRGDWALQTTTDLAQLPHGEPGQPIYRGDYGIPASAAPVNAAGQPVVYDLVESYEQAANDGERWRWLLAAAAQRGRSHQAALRRAEQAEAWFSVSTLGWYWRRARTQLEKDTIWKLEHLPDDESIARLANGIQRFTLPEEWNYIRIYQELEQWDRLAEIFANRNQRARAAEAWLQAEDVSAYERVVKPWLHLRTVPAQSVGETPRLPLMFRNATSAHIQVQPVRLQALAAHHRERVRNPEIGQPWQRQFHIQLRRYLTDDENARWLGDAVAFWEEDLQPAEGHQDRTHYVPIPLDKPGAFVVTAQAEGGNVSRALLWMIDTVVVQMPISGEASGQLLFVADAVSGEPVAELPLQGFGYRVLRYGSNEKPPEIAAREVEVTSDAQGMVLLPHADDFGRYQWLFMSEDGQRLAMWEGGMRWRNWRQSSLRRQRAQVFTNRPLFRPGGRVAGKVWAVNARYDDDHDPLQSDRMFTIRIRNARGDRVYEERHRSDRWGGVTFAYDLPDDASLGVYRVSVVQGGRNIGQGRFRVEEYRLPEFAVHIDAPEKPVLLGDTLRARVSAEYLWGQPVRQAEVEYTVTRRTQDQRWYPSMPWDWLYGSGYWWHWHNAPLFSHNPWQAPELVAQGQALLDADGGFDLAIDTALAKALSGEKNHRYTITVQVRDASRRTEVAQGDIIASAQPFAVRVWTPPGYLQAGTSTTVQTAAQRADGGAIPGEVEARLYRLSYDEEGHSSSVLVHSWQQQLNQRGRGQKPLQLDDPGQYRVQIRVQYGQETVESEHLITVIGDADQPRDPANYRFRALEILPDREEYAPGDRAELLIASGQANATVLLFVRPENGTYPSKPTVLRLRDGATLEQLKLTTADQPNIFVEALTVQGAQVHRVTQQLLVPPRQRSLQVDIQADATSMRPGEAGAVTLQVRDLDGEAVRGSAIVSIYDKGLDLLAGDMLPTPMRQTFWQWTRQHRSNIRSGLPPLVGDMRRVDEPGMQRVGLFSIDLPKQRGAGFDLFGGPSPSPAGARRSVARQVLAGDERSAFGDDAEDADGQAFTPALRQEFADSILWTGALTLDADGQARLPFTLSDSLTTWQVRAAAIAEGAAVGEGSAHIVAAKDLMLRLHAPRFATEGDIFILSLSIHNDHDHPATVRHELSIDGAALEILGNTKQHLEIPAGGEERLDIPVRAVAQGTVSITASVVGRVNGVNDGDALTRNIPIHIYGAETTEVASMVMAADQQDGQLTLTVPQERIPEASQLILRWSPTVAGAAIEAVPYLVDYPYGCTEQTLNRFVPAVIAQRLLKDLDIDLEALRQRRALLNPGLLGSPEQRDPQHQRPRWRNPVYDPHEIDSMVAQGIHRLAQMQMSDGGWGWFSGHGERSGPHTTAVVVRGLLIARENGAEIPEDILASGLRWLRHYQSEQVGLLQRGELAKEERRENEPYRSRSGSLDALIALIR